MCAPPKPLLRSHATQQSHLRPAGFDAAPPPPGTSSSNGGDGGRQGYGRIDLIIGPMFAGKTTLLMERIARHRAAGQRVMVVRSQVDTRSTQGHIQTHDGKRGECHSLQRLDRLWGDEMLADYNASQVIAVDEAQFFPDLFQAVVRMADRDNKFVYVAGLDGDYKREAFLDGGLLKLVPHAESIVKLQADCHLCGSGDHSAQQHQQQHQAAQRGGGGAGAAAAAAAAAQLLADCEVGKASFTQRTVASSAQVLVGGADKYRSVCRFHMLDPEATRDDVGALAQELGMPMEA